MSQLLVYSKITGAFIDATQRCCGMGGIPA